MTEALIIFAKNPVWGNTKTRIGNRLGHEVALAVYNRLIHRVQEVTGSLPYRKMVFYSDFIDAKDSWDNRHYLKQQQHGHNLGSRMAHALAYALSSHRKAVLIGTDIYELDADIIGEGFEALNRSDVVLGPAHDGGYYLIGMKKAEDALFALKQWSTPTVLEETLKIVRDRGLSYHLLPVLNDIDEPEDLLGTDLEEWLS